MSDPVDPPNASSNPPGADAEQTTPTVPAAVTAEGTPRKAKISSMDLKEKEEGKDAYVQRLNKEVDPYYVEMDVAQFFAEFLPGEDLSEKQLKDIGGFEEVPDLSKSGREETMYAPIVSESLGVAFM